MQERSSQGGAALNNDAMDWQQQLARDRKVDAVVTQVGLALAAIHTTGDLLFKTIGRIAAHPEVLPELREEIEQAISVHGLNKTGVYNMQRLDAVALAIMKWYATEDID
ncbi:Cytochrome P450 [Penicillium soppii]|jgi:cytochrome P450|uniref:Cytochrome P450 n=1 Tax=Penicillium soppii TaxID=69789 RepID=UPI002546D54D|nr:Cytochrome P450 [Penicillium soppii]KAJ5882411.1 Cytochrome P450 [Penicillium soppii]